MPARKTATEILVEAMEAFGQSEPVSVVVLWRDRTDVMHLIHNSSSYEVVALTEIGKHMTIQQMVLGD
jgi:hypothetical protein